jgi:hypothetical protein
LDCTPQVSLNSSDLHFGSLNFDNIRNKGPYYSVLANEGESVQLHAPANLRPWYPLDRRLGETQCQSGSCGDETISCFFPESNPNFSVVQPVE